MVPTTIREEAPTGNAPLGAIPPKAATIRFPLLEENQTSEAPGVVFDPTTEEKGVETPLPNDSYQASINPPVGGRLRSFRRDWHANNCSANVLNIITNGYVLPFLSRPNLIRFPLIVSEYKAPQKDQALADCIQSLLLKNAIERVENVKSLGFYSRLFLVPKPHQRWRPVIDLSRLNTFLHVEKFKMETPESIRTSLIPGEWVASIDLSDAYLHIPIHPNSRKYLRFCHRSQVFQFTSLPFGLATAPQVFTMVVKEVKLMALSRGLRLHQYLDDWLIRSQSQEEALVNTRAVVDLTQSLGWIINQEKSELKPTQVFSFVGYEYHLDSALVKPTQERWLKLQDLILRLKSKHVLTARCLMSLIGLLASTEKMVPEGRLHMRPFQFHLKEHWKFPQSLDSLLPWTEVISAHLDWWQNPTNVMRGADLHPKDHSIQLFTDASNVGWGAHLDQSSTKGLWSPQEKGLHINVLELKAVSLALRHFKDQCQDQTVLVATDNSTVVAYINKQGGTHSAEMCALLWKLMTWCHHYHITLKARHIPGCLNVMADLLSRSNQVQSTEWSLHPQVFKQICLKWFTPHVDLFATHLNHKLPLYVSPIPDPQAWDIDALNIDWTGLTAYAYPPTAKNQAVHLPVNSPRLGCPSAALNRDPSATPGVDNTPQAVPQLRVPQLPAAPQPPRLVSRSGQLQEQGFSVEVAERIAAPQRSSTRNIYKSKWALFEKWCRDNSVDFSSPSVKQISDFFMYLYQDLNRRPSTIDGYRTAIVDTLGPTAQHIAHNEDLHRLLSSFHRDRPKSSRNLPQWNLSVVLNELTKAPFEPMKDTDLKHLTLKTAFLLALASGKRRSEIHAWVANKVSNLGQWEKVALFPSSDFIAKNQLAREGSQSVSPVTIPALTTIVDRQFKEDRTLCPVRALRYYLDRTKDLRGSRSLLFISFKKGHTSDIRPATLSSWLKQTILLCYKQADQQALDLVQVKAHDIRAFAASKAFYGGVSVDQIMQACHWKAHNTFTNFYLKDLTWSDNDNNMYLGPVVAAQQVLDPSPQ